MSGIRRQLQANLFFSVVDRHVAQRVRLRRRQIGMSPHRLAELIGMTYEQVHKYETGLSRIAAARLHAIALALDTDVAFFFEGIAPNSLITGQKDKHRRLVELVRDVQRIAKPDQRQAICLAARALAGRVDQQPAELD